MLAQTAATSDVNSDNDLSSTKATPVEHGTLSIHSEDSGSAYSTVIFSSQIDQEIQLAARGKRF